MLPSIMCIYLYIILKAVTFHKLIQYYTYISLNTMIYNLNFVIMNINLLLL